MHNRLGHRFQRRLDVPVWLERGPQGESYADKVLGLLPDNLVAYWPFWDESGPTAENIEGTAARNGTYINTPTLGVEGIGDGRTAAFFDPTNSECVNIYSPSLNAAWDPVEGGMLTWQKASALSVWTDATQRYIHRIRADASNEVTNFKSGTNNRVPLYYTAGGTAEVINLDGLTTIDFFALLVTWSVADDEWRGYLDGVHQSTQVALGAWVGNLNAVTTVACLRLPFARIAHK